jgi:hypothetical protein
MHHVVYYSITPYYFGNKEFANMYLFLSLFGSCSSLQPYKEAETDVMPIGEMSFQCPFLGSVTIQRSEGDTGVDKLVDVLVAHGVSSDKIRITSYEDIQKKAHADKIRAEQERPKKKRRMV